MAGILRDREALLCVSLGGLVTLPAALLAVASGGAGHGNYLFAKVLFPYAMLLTRLTDDTVTLPLIVLGLAQFPLYGAVVGLAASRSGSWLALRRWLTLAHLGAVALCFSGTIPNFLVMSPAILPPLLRALTVGAGKRKGLGWRARSGCSPESCASAQDYSFASFSSPPRDDRLPSDARRGS